MNVSLTPELDKFVASKVDSGEYATASEVVRDGLRMLRAAEEARRVKLDALREEIKKGQAGPYHDLDLVLNEMQARYE
jgi:antitoxin ParD1/3/4